MPESLRGKSTHSGKAPTRAQSFRFETSQGTPPYRHIHFFREAGGMQSAGDDTGRSFTVRRYLPPLLQRITPFAPIADSAVHGDDVGVSHFLQVVGSQRGTAAAT